MHNYRYYTYRIGLDVNSYIDHHYLIDRNNLSNDMFVRFDYHPITMQMMCYCLTDKLSTVLFDHYYNKCIVIKNKTKRSGDFSKQSEKNKSITVEYSAYYNVITYIIINKKIVYPTRESISISLDEFNGLMDLIH